MRSISDDDKKNIQSIIQSWLNRVGHEGQLECPAPESIAGYAFGELDPSDEKLIESHVINCPKCLAEVIDLREIKASTDSPVPKVLSRILSLAKLGKKTRQEIVDRLVEKLSSIYPGYTELELAYAPDRGTKDIRNEIIRLPRQIWYSTKPRGKRIEVLGSPNNERTPELKPLVDALQIMSSFYCFTFGIGKDNRLKMIDDIDQIGERHLPIEYNVSDLNDVDILWVVIDSDQETLQHIYHHLKKDLGKRRLTMPKIEPFAWIIVFLE